MINRDYRSVLLSLNSVGYLTNDIFSSSHHIMRLTRSDLEQAGLASTQQGLPKLCDYNSLHIAPGQDLTKGYYGRTFEILHSIYSPYKKYTLDDGNIHPSSLAIREAINALVNFVQQSAGKLDRSFIETKLAQTIYTCEAEICKLHCISDDNPTESLSTLYQRLLPCTSTCQIISDLQVRESYQSLIQNGHGFSTASTFALPNQCNNPDFDDNALTLSGSRNDKQLSSSVSEIAVSAMALYVAYRSIKGLIRLGTSFFGKKQIEGTSAVISSAMVGQKTVL